MLWPQTQEYLTHYTLLAVKTEEGVLSLGKRVGSRSWGRRGDGLSPRAPGKATPHSNFTPCVCACTHVCRHMCVNVCACACACSVAQSCPTLCNPMDCSLPAPLSMGFSRQEYWSGLPCPPPGDLPDPGIELKSLCVSCTAGGFFTTAPPVRLISDVLPQNCEMIELSCL